MKGYRHLNWNDRIYIERLVKLNYSKKSIAEIIGCSLATIYNELNRGKYTHLKSDLSTDIIYAPDLAERKYRRNLSLKGQVPKISKDEKLKKYISELIVKQDLSPEAVLFEQKANNIMFNVSINSPQTIYVAIRKGLIDGVRMTDLPRRGKKKQKKKKIEAVPAYWREKRGNSIDERPQNVNDRLEFGHWEMDSVIGKSNNKKTVLVLTERVTRYEIVEVLKSHSMLEVVRALNRIEKRTGSDFYKVFKSITVDNGSEFKDYRGIEKALRRKGNRTTLYYCHPRSPQERGSNENNNILLRRCRGLEKGANFDKTISYRVCKDAEFWINSYPRRSFNGKCSYDKFKEELLKLGCKIACI